MDGDPKDIDKSIFILTSNASGGTSIKDALDSTLKANPALLDRFKAVKLDPMPPQLIARVKGRVAAKKLGDKGLTEDQEQALGDAINAVFGTEDEGLGMRHVAKQIEDALTQTLPFEAEEKLAAASPAFAARTASRRGDRLAEAFHRKMEVKPMKPLRFVTPPGKRPA